MVQDLQSRLTQCQLENEELKSENAVLIEERIVVTDRQKQILPSTDNDAQHVKLMRENARLQLVSNVMRKSFKKSTDDARCKSECDKRTIETLEKENGLLREEVLIRRSSLVEVVSKEVQLQEEEKQDHMKWQALQEFRFSSNSSNIYKIETKGQEEDKEKKQHRLQQQPSRRRLSWRESHQDSKSTKKCCWQALQEFRFSNNDNSGIYKIETKDQQQEGGGQEEEPSSCKLSRRETEVSKSNTAPTYLLSESGITLPCDELSIDEDNDNDDDESSAEEVEIMDFPIKCKRIDVNGNETEKDINPEELKQVVPWLKWAVKAKVPSPRAA